MADNFEQSYEKAMKAAAGPLAGTHGLDPAGRYVGTCQGCFGQYVVKASRGRLRVVLHGYERPGIGHLIGDCPGHGHEPFEVSKDQTIVFRESLVGQLAGLRKQLARLKSGDVTEIYIEVEDESIPRSYGQKRATKAIAIGPGWKNPSPHKYYDTYEKRMQSKIAEVAGQVGGVESAITFMDMMIERWKYTPESLKDTKGKKIGVRADDQAKAEKEASERNSSRKTARDEKEKKVNAVLDVLLASEALMSFMKERSNAWGPPIAPGPQPSLHDVIMKRIERYRAADQVTRIEGLRRVGTDLKDYAHRAGIKVKIPRG